MIVASQHSPGALGATACDKDGPAGARPSRLGEQQGMGHPGSGSAG
jgi:hypothetical protein